MKVSEAIKKRRSIRRFKPNKEISDQEIEKLLKAARWAPSAGNLQSRQIFIIRKKLIKRLLSEAAYGQEFINQAPLALVICADLKTSALKYGNRGRSLYCLQDATLAAQNIWLTATEIGLGACWVGAFNETEVIKILDLPKNLRPIIILAIGFPAESPQPPARHPLDQITEEI
jgi:nitroreductase